MRSARDYALSAGAQRPSAQPVPPLCCDCCSWPMNANEITRAPDGAILGLIVCSLCVEDSLAARQLEPVTL